MPSEKQNIESTTLTEARQVLLARRLKGLQQADEDQVDASIAPRPPGTAPLIGIDQYSVWLNSTLHPESPVSNEALTVRCFKDVDLRCMEAALNAFVARHEVWRTSFIVRHGEVYQEVAPLLQVALTVVDLTSFSAFDREVESQHIAQAQAMTSFDLEQAPLYRFTLVRFGPHESRLHVVVHHLVCDGYSLRRTFLTELAALYNSFKTGSISSLKTAKLQYADWTQWRRRELQTPVIKTQLQYWLKELAGELPILHLPGGRSRPARISHQGDVVRFTLSRELTESLRSLARSYGATLYMALLATWKTVLFRYSGQEDLIVGSVANGRRLPELEGMMGYMLDVFAIRSAPTSAKTFSVYLQEVKQKTVEALSASEIPFTEVVSALDDQSPNRKRDSSQHPVFQTAFVFQPAADQSSRDWDIYTSEVSTGTTKFELYVEADEKSTHTAMRLYYSTDLYDGATIERLADEWLTLIEGVVASPETSLGNLPLLTAKERQQMLVEWNAPACPSASTASPRTANELVRAQAEKTPDAIAIVFENNTVTYRELMRESNGIAHQLILAGAAPGKIVAIFMERSQYLVAGLLGILDTGAAYMPLDPGTPSARIKLCLEDAEPAIVLTRRSSTASLPDTGSAKVVFLEDILGTPYPSDFETVPSLPDSPAYVIHTSGSTGKPKGVEVTHEGVANLLLSMASEPGFTQGDTLVAVTTISFDIAVLEIFLPLITGGRTVVASRETALDPNLLSDLVQNSQCTVMQATPATWSALISNGWKPDPGLKILCGGEVLSRALADRLLALKVELWNMYGPTETTIWSTTQRVVSGSGSVAVGRPIANTTTYILDNNKQPVPIGVPGELYIGGSGVARGYRNKPELTSEKFLLLPVAGGKRLYRTGDKALYRADGSIEVLGRTDNQVKIRGHRIELEDVEVNLAAHPAIAFVAARAWPDETGEFRLTAYLVGVNGPPPPASELRRFMRKRVADYMIPSDMIVLDRMPLTSNGKIDRKQLAQPQRTILPPNTDEQTPLAGEEGRLAVIWRDLLQVEEVRASDNFFDLGGHSLMLLKLIKLINKEFTVELPIARLFQAPTIEKLAFVIRELSKPVDNKCDEWCSLVPLNPHGTKRPLFLIHSLMLYGRLPSALGADQPFYALQQPPLGQDDKPDWVDRMIEDHIRQIRKVQPRGPYQIAGWCFAGWMAYEIARRLETQGEKVTTLALLDSWCPVQVGKLPLSGSIHRSASARRGFKGRVKSLFHKLRAQSRRLQICEPAERIKLFRGMLKDFFVDCSLPVIREVKDRLYRLCLRFDLPKPKMLNDVKVVTYEWLRQYQLKPYSGPITLIRPEDLGSPAGSDPNCGWRDFTTGKIATTFVPGDRRTMFLNPNLVQLAVVLTSLLEGE